MPTVTTPSGNTLEFDYTEEGMKEAKELAEATGGDLDVQGYNAGGRVKRKQGYQMGGPVRPMGGQPQSPMGPGGMPPGPMTPQGRAGLMSGVTGQGPKPPMPGGPRPPMPGGGRPMQRPPMPGRGGRPMPGRPGARPMPGGPRRPGARPGGRPMPGRRGPGMPMPGRRGPGRGRR